MPASDNAVVQRVHRGDTEAFAELVARYQEAVYGLALAMIGDADDAQDVAQSCFVRAFRRLGELRDGDRFRSWLFAIVRSRCRDWLRQQSRRPALVGDPRELASADPPGLLGNPHGHAPSPRDQAVKRAVNSLPPRYRAVVTLRYTGDLTFAEIAEALGLSPSGVRMRWHRARKMLRERLRERPSDEEGSGLE